ncbi:hypothetical protein MTP99_008272 [Tenebrio molitor]|jgi:hypothetical protein|nr:hypothetical protein MTP99_008272 [Tenebrio molitor]
MELDKEACRVRFRRAKANFEGWCYRGEYLPKSGVAYEHQITQACKFMLIRKRGTYHVPLKAQILRSSLQHTSDSGRAEARVAAAGLTETPVKLRSVSDVCERAAALGFAIYQPEKFLLPSQHF